MRRSTSLALWLSLAAFAAACGEQATTPTDVEPLFAKGKPGGGGTTETDPTATFVLPVGDSGYGLTAVGISEYENGVCGVTSKIFATTEASNSGDAVMNTTNPRNRDARTCADYPRRVAIDFGAEHGTEEVEIFINVAGIHNTKYWISQGETARHKLTLNPYSSSVCDDRLVFDDAVAGSSSVHVTRIDGRTWRVRTDDPATTDVETGSAVCLNTGVVHSVPVDFTVIASRDLTP